MSINDAFNKLHENPQPVLEEAVRLFNKIIDNILKEPHNLKIRTLKKSNSIIHKNILSVKGGLECLKLMGFKEDNSTFTIPPNVSLNLIKQFKTELETWKHSNFAPRPKPLPKPTEQVKSHSISNSNYDVEEMEHIDRIITPPLVPIFSHPFLKSIEMYSHTTLQYSDKKLLERAKKYIPLTELEIKAQERLRNMQEYVKKNKMADPDYSIQDMLILELLKWFKEDFFEWVDSPPCSTCNGETTFSHMSTDKNLLIYTNRVELHRCKSCHNFTPFPRYNDLNILLETRKGRCGEWANVFTLFCHSMGWDSRYVVDQGDHVWTEELEQLVGYTIAKRTTNMRECVSSGERLLITLRYLGSGCTFSSLALYFVRGDTTISRIVRETTAVIWNTLRHTYMKIPSLEKWQEIANRFYEVWNLPNCLGAIDGKHIKIQQLPNSGSTNYNYKQYHSIVLMAACDADGLFTMIQTGFAGRNNDGGIFRASNLSRLLERGELNLPEDACLPHDEQRQKFPFYFVGDNAFPLKRFLMRPYPQNTLDNKKRIYNYRLSRGRKTIECSFGMMTQKFQVFLTPIRCIEVNTIVNIIKCACVLHNYVRCREGTQYSIARFEPLQNTPQNLNLNEEIIFLTPRSSGTNVRNYLSNYFLKSSAALPWQYNYCL